jgi:hypothetical protein
MGRGGQSAEQILFGAGTLGDRIDHHFGHVVTRGQPIDPVPAIANEREREALQAFDRALVSAAETLAPLGTGTNRWLDGALERISECRERIRLACGGAPNTEELRAPVNERKRRPVPMSRYEEEGDSLLCVREHFAIGLGGLRMAIGDVEKGKSELALAPLQRAESVLENALEELDRAGADTPAQERVNEAFRRIAEIAERGTAR